MRSFWEILTNSALDQTKGLVLDVGYFSCGHSRLGGPLDPRDFFSAHLLKKDVFETKAEGLEIGAEDNVLDYVFITVEFFKGTWCHRGNYLELNWRTVPEDIQAQFGTPYWIDHADDETILFYEFNQGAIELQFEFPRKKHLGHVTLLRNGVLSNAADRRAYGVTAPWPPRSR